MSKFFYICDSCGNLVTITDAAIPEGEEWECECGTRALWEFENERKAMEHAAHIQRGVGSGLFRRAR